MRIKNLLLALVCGLALGVCFYVALSFITHIVLLGDQVIAFLFALVLTN